MGLVADCEVGALATSRTSSTLRTVLTVADCDRLRSRPRPAATASCSATNAKEDDDVVLRIWRGWTSPENGDAYERIVSEEVLPGIAARQLAGYHGAFLLRRTLDNEVEFATIMQFDSLDAVRAFAGEDHEVAYVPPRAHEVLSRFDQTSTHYDVLMTP